jgi:hypothetical protein
VFSVFIILALCFAGTGCTVKYVADYDANIKDEIIQISKKIDLFWGDLLDTPVGDRKYIKFKDKYNEIESDLRGLVTQNEIRALNRESTKQAENALDLWVQDRDLHKKNDSFTDFEAKQHRKQYNRVFIAMAKGEEAKNVAPEK